MDQSDALLRRQAIPFDVSFRAFAEILVERLLHRGDIAFAEQRLREVGARDDLTARLRLDILKRYIPMQLSLHPLNDPGIAKIPILYHLPKTAVQRSVLRVYKQAEDMALTDRHLGAQLNPRHDFDAQPTPGLHRLSQRGRGVVIGHRERSQS